MDPQQTKIVIIGSGNVGTQLALELMRKGFRISQVFSREESHARQLAEQLSSDFTARISDINTSADFYFLAIKDDVIRLIADELRLPGKVVVHTSGSVDMAVLKSISAQCGVFYPLQTFTKSRPAEWQQIPICIEAADEATATAIERIARLLSRSIHRINSGQRRWLHLAAVFVNNFGNYLLSQAQSITQAHDLPLDILKPLALETAKKAFQVGPQKAQTGPAVRGDKETIARHLEMLKNNAEAQKLYALLTEMIEAGR